MAIARITDIRGLVTLGENSEEILKNRDLISEHGGILTIDEFAKIIFEDGREVDINGPISFNLESSFFNEGTFDQSITQLSDISSIEYINQNFNDIIEETPLTTNLAGQEETISNIETEQLDSSLNSREFENDLDGNITNNIEETDITINETTSHIEESEVLNDDESAENEAPVVQSVSTSLFEDNTTSGKINFTDSDGTAEVFAEGSLPEGFVLNTDGTFSFDSGAYDYLKEGQVEQFVIPVVVTDNDGASVSSVITINVTGTNDAPTLTVDSTATVAEDGAVSINFSASDVDGTIASTTASVDPIQGTVVVNNDGTITFTAAPNFNGDANITVVTTDDDGATATQNSTITVSDVNDAPTIIIGDITATEDTAQVLANVSDIDGTIDSSNLSATNGTVTIDETTGDITYTPNDNFNGIDSVTISVTDNDGATTSQTFDVNVASVNDGPIAVDDNGNDTIIYTEITPSTSQLGNLNDSSSENSLESLLNTDEPVHVTINTYNGSWLSTVNLPDDVPIGQKVTLDVDSSWGVNVDINNNGSVDNTISYGDSVTYIKTINGWEDVNDVIDPNIISEDTTVTLDVLSNDSDLDGDSLSITHIQGQDVSSGGTVDITISGTVVGTAAVVDGKIQFTPGSDLQNMNDGENQDVTFDYTVSDSNGGSDNANVTLNISGSDDNINPDAVDDTTHTVDISTTTTIFDSSFEDGNGDWHTDLDGWSAASGEKIESWTGTGADGNDYIELNTDDSNSFSDASSISRTVNTVDGADYNLNFDFSARPDYDATVCKIEVLVDGVVVGTYSADGTGLSSVSWQNESLTFTGDGTPMEIEFREAGVNVTNGRGMYLDDIELTQTVVTTQTQAISTDEDTAIAVDVLSNDSDSDGGTLSVSQIQGQDVSSGQTINVVDTDGSTVIGTATVVSGEILFTPGTNLQTMDSGSNQNISFDYTVSDGQGGTNNANVTINVTGNDETLPIVSGDVLFSEDFSTGIDGWSGSDSNAISNDSGTLQISGSENSYETATKTFDFGIENAGKEVTVSFDASTQGSWNTSGSNIDYFTVEAHNSQVINWDSTIDTSYSFTTTVANDGTIKIDMTTATTADEEAIRIDNFEITASGSDWIQTAQLVDGIVEGAYYETSSGVTGYTDENGNFNFRAGDDVTFSVGGVTLGVATFEDIASGQTFLQDIADVDRTDLNDEYLENMAVFLQSIDTETSGDNIVITEAMSNALVDADIDLRTASEEEVQQLIESVGGTYVDENEAMIHVQEMLEEYAGIDSTEFEEREEDIESAVLGNEPRVGVEYQTSSGINGITDETGTFQYNDGDSITFTQNGEILSTIDSENIGDDSLLTINELEEFNQEEVDFENLELDFDNIAEIIDVDESSVYEESESEENPQDLELADMLHTEDADMSLSSLLGETQENLDAAKEDTTSNVSESEENSNGDYCPFKALEESSSNLIGTIEDNDIVESNDE